MLERARTEIAAGNYEPGLAALLDAWRAKRAPRIADAVDLVSRAITRSRAKIDAKMVRDRSAKWIEIAKLKDPADVGRLFATPWPKKWKDAKPLFDILSEFPDDPRTATALCDVGMRESTLRWPGRFLKRLTSLLDIRTLPLIKAFKSIEPAEEEPLREVIAALEAHAPLVRLSKEEEQTLTAIEACFENIVAGAKSVATNEAKLLAAIYADPDSDAPRAVLADYLTEQNDPRGEFIALQIARANAPAGDVESIRREEELLAKFGKNWGGPLDAIITRTDRTYERGFVASGILFLNDEPAPLPPELESPSLATMTTLGATFLENRPPKVIASILAHPAMRFVRSLRGFSIGVIVALLETFDEARKNDSRLEEIALDFPTSIWTAAMPPEMRRDLEAIARAGASFPKLTHLGLSVSYTLEPLWVLFGGGGGKKPSLGKKLETLTLYSIDYQPAEIIKRIEEDGLLPNLKELHFRPDTITFDNDAKSDRWHFTFRRDPERGNRFTKLHAEPCGRPRKLPDMEVLASAIKTLRSPDGLSALSIRKTATACSNEDILRIERRLEAFKLLQTDLPWGRVDPNAPSPKEPAGDVLPPFVSEGPLVFVELHGKELSKNHATELFTLAMEPPVALAFDRCAVNYKGFVDFPVEKKAAVAHVKKTILLKRTERLVVSRKGMELTDRGSITFQANEVALTMEIRDKQTADDYVGWLTRVLETATTTTTTIDRGEVSFVEERRPSEYSGRTLVALGRPFRWISILGPTLGEHLPFDELVTLSKKLEWLRVERTPSGKNLIVVLSPSPREIPENVRVAKLEIAVAELLWRTWAKKHGGTPGELARSLLSEPLAKLGFTYAEQPDAFKRAMTHARFVSPGNEKMYELTTGIWKDKTTFSLNQHDDGGREKSMFTADDHQTLRAKLEGIRTRLDVGWFDMFKHKKKA